MSDGKNSIVAMKSDMQIQAALAYMLEHPSASMTEIADHVGISRPTLYKVMGSNEFADTYQMMVKAPLREAATKLANSLPDIVGALIDIANNTDSADRDRVYAAATAFQFIGMDALELTESSGVRISFSPITVNVSSGDIQAGKSPNVPRSQADIIEGVIRQIED